MTIDLIPLATVTIGLDPPLVVDGAPNGSRYIAEVSHVALTGDRVNATLKGRAAADWLTLGADGTGTIDVRMLLETDDGALVFVQYHGRIDLSPGGDAVAFAAPRFETGDERYAWLNKIQAVGKGAFDGSGLVYEWYEVR